MIDARLADMIEWIYDASLHTVRLSYERAAELARAETVRHAWKSAPWLRRMDYFLIHNL